MSSKARRGSGLRYMLEMNTKTVIICAIFTFIAIYSIYTWIPLTSPGSSNSQMKFYNSWKTHELVDIPADLLNMAKTVKIEERTLTFDVDDQKVKIFFIEAEELLENTDDKIFPILLLHGAGSSSKVWHSTIQLIAAMGIKAVALDLPGWAKSKDTPLPESLHGRFIERFIEQEKLRRPVIVTASMSGQFSIPYLMEPKPNSCDNRARALVSLAPTHTESYTAAQYHRCEIPVMIVYGTKDKNLGLTANGNLRNMPNSEIYAMEGAGHACYQERPDEWHKLLYNFLRAVEHDNE